MTTAPRPVDPLLCALCEQPMGDNDDQQTQYPGTPYCGDCWHARNDNGAYLRTLFESPAQESRP